MTEIAVVRALALGDMLCAIPTLRSLRARFPDATITLVGLPWAQILVHRFPMYLDGFLEFPGYPGIPEVRADPGRTIGFLDRMQRRQWDLVVQLQGDGTVINQFVSLFGARQIAAFTPPGAAAPPIHDGETFVPYQPHGSEVDRLLALAAALGGPVDRRLEFPVAEDDLHEIDRLLEEQGRDERPIAVVHPGGSTPARRWPAQRFAAVADELARDGSRIVLTGTEAETPVTADVSRRMSNPALDLAGRTTLGGAAALLERARILVTNDTGISHLAAAVGADSVTVFVASDRDRWAPVGSGRQVAVGPGMRTMGCAHDPDASATPHRCLGDACTYGLRRYGPEAQADVSVDDVLRAARELLDHPPVEVMA